MADITEIYKEIEIQKNTHKKFKEKYGSEVFYIYSYKSGNQKIIKNIEVIDEIKKEIERLKSI